MQQNKCLKEKKTRQHLALRKLTPGCQKGPGTYQAFKRRCKVPCLGLSALSVCVHSVQ